MSTFFTYVYNIISTHKALFITLLITFSIAAGYYANKLSFSEDITNVLPDSDKINQLNFVLDNSEFMEKVVFNICLTDTTQKADPGLLVRFTNQLSDSIKKRYIPTSISSIEKAPEDAEFLKVYDFIYQNMPLFLNLDDYKEIEKKVSDTNIRHSLQSNLKTLISPVGFGAKNMIKNDPLHLTAIALEKLK